MPRAQRTQSAVHEALQRRAGHGPGDGFSAELGAAVLLRPSLSALFVQQRRRRGAFVRLVPTSAALGSLDVFVPSRS